MQPYRPLTIAARLRLEAALLARWGAKHADQCLRQLRPWSGWRWPLEAELREAVPWVSRPARARHLREAREALPAMMRSPTLTPSDELALLQQKVNFGLLPRTALVLPEDRVLSPWHALAICGRGLPMTTVVSRIIGGTWVRSVQELQEELDRRREEQDSRLADLREYEEEPGSRPESGGLIVDSVRF